MHKPVLIARDGNQKLEAWALLHDTEDGPVYELFASEECTDYIGDADTLEDCKTVAKAWFADRATY